MKITDIEEGGQVLVRYHIKRLGGFGPVRGWTKVRVVRKLPLGRIVVAEDTVVWDRDMRLSGKKPIVKTREYEMASRSARPVERKEDARVHLPQP